MAVLLQCLEMDYCQFKNETPLPNVSNSEHFLVFVKVTQLKYVSIAIILNTLC